MLARMWSFIAAIHTKRDPKATTCSTTLVLYPISEERLPCPGASSSARKVFFYFQAQRELEKERRAQESEGKKIVDELKNLAVNEPEVIVVWALKCA